jgi:hypothetical protein
MRQRASAFVTFGGYFVRYALHIREVLVGLLLLIVLGGVAISRIEGIDLGEGIYFAFITGLSIGYGDIHPTTGWGQVVSVAIGLIGLIFTGVTVAVATRALADSLKHLRKHAS